MHRDGLLLLSTGFSFFIATSPVRNVVRSFLFHAYSFSNFMIYIFSEPLFLIIIRYFPAAILPIW